MAATASSHLITPVDTYIHWQLNEWLSSGFLSSFCHCWACCKMGGISIWFCRASRRPAFGTWETPLLISLPNSFLQENHLFTKLILDEYLLQRMTPETCHLMMLPCTEFLSISPKELFEQHVPNKEEDRWGPLLHTKSRAILCSWGCADNFTVVPQLTASWIQTVANLIISFSLRILL